MDRLSCWEPSTLTFALLSKASPLYHPDPQIRAPQGVSQSLASKRVVSSNKREGEDVGFSFSAELGSVAVERMMVLRRVKPPAQRCDASQAGCRPDAETGQGGQVG